MENRYIKITADEIVGYPIKEENIKVLFSGVLPNAVTLKEAGYVKIKEDKPLLLEGQTATYDGVVYDDGVASVKWKLSTSLVEAKANKKAHLKELFKAKSTRPKVDTTLGFFVDGSQNDLLSFENGQKLGLTFVKDADGVTHEIKIEDWDTILLKIREHGLALFQEKWELEAKIDACTTAKALNALNIDGAFGTAVEPLVE